MIRFESLEDLNDQFQRGTVEITDLVEEGLEVNGAEYRSTNENIQVPMDNILHKNRKLYAVFSLIPKPESQTAAARQQLNDKLICSWQLQSKNEFVPNRFISVDRSQLIQAAIRESQEIIGKSLTVNFKLPDFGDIVGKVDTGADGCSLHVENIQFDKENMIVSFSRGGRSFRMTAVDCVSVQTAGNEDDLRPVILCKVESSDVQCTVQVNLNDRSNMPDEFLIGNDLLQELGVLIDPIKEDINWEMLDRFEAVDES